MPQLQSPRFKLNPRVTGGMPGAGPNRDQAQQQLQQFIAESELPTELLIDIGRWAQQVIKDPKQFPAFQAWLKSQGLDESDIPQKPDYQELAGMVTVGYVAEQTQQPATSDAASLPPGPVSPDQLASLAQQGTYGDTQLAHINSEEAAVLESMGGSGTINPQTGLPQYNFFSDLWDGVKKLAKKVAPFILPIVAIAFPQLIPMIGSAVGASAALAPVVGAGVISAGTALVTGANVGEALLTGGLTALGAYLSPVVGGYLGKTLGVTDPGLVSALGSAGLSAGVSILRGQAVGKVLESAISGATSNYLGQIASNAINSGNIVNSKIKQEPFNDLVFVSADAKGLADAGLSENAIRSTLISTGVDSQVATSAAMSAVRGTDADVIATQLSNGFGSSFTTVYRNGTGVENSIVGAGNVKSLEAVQRAEDARFLAEDVVNLRSQGLSTAQIRDTLTQAGVSPNAVSAALQYSGRPGTDANYVANEILRTADSAGVTQIFATPDTPASVEGPTRPTASDALRQEDADFLAADAAQLRAQGLGPDQIKLTLEAAGVPSSVARDASFITIGGPQSQELLQRSSGPLYTDSGASASPVMGPPSPVMGPPQPTVPTAPAAFVGPVDPALADAEFLAADAAQLRGQGLNQNQIRDTLIATGARPDAALAAATLATRNFSSESITNNLASQFRGQDIFTAVPRPEPVTPEPVTPEPVTPEPVTPEPVVAPVPAPDLATQDAEFLAADAAGQKDAGLGQDQIIDNLIAAGATPEAAIEAGIGVEVGLTTDQIVNNILTNTGADTPKFVEPAPVPVPVPEPVAPAAPAAGPARTGLPANAQEAMLPGRGVMGYQSTNPDGSYDYYDATGQYLETFTYDANGNPIFYVRSDQAQPDVQGGMRIDIQGVGSIPSEDALFVAADAAQLFSQGLTQSQIESNLLYAGVEPLVAADAAQLASSGYNEATIAQNITQSGTVTDEETGAPSVVIFNPPGVPPQPALPGYLGPAGSEPGTAVTPTQPVAVQPTPDTAADTSAGDVVTRPVEPVVDPATLSPVDVGAIIAADQVAQDVIGDQDQPGRQPQGTFTPQAPDPSWSRPLVYPGLNPGLVGAGIRPAYETTSPVQSQYYYGRQPFFNQLADLSLYGTSPAQPAQPFGIQQGYFEQPQNTPPVPVYGPNLVPIDPGLLPSSLQIGANQPTVIRPTATVAPVMPDEVTARFRPELFSASQQNMLPYNLYQTQLPAQPSYVYNVAPRASQYSIPTASPV